MWDHHNAMEESVSCAFTQILSFLIPRTSEQFVMPSDKTYSGIAPLIWSSHNAIFTQRRSDLSLLASTFAFPSIAPITGSHGLGRSVSIQTETATS